MFPAAGPAYDLPLEEFRARARLAETLRDWRDGKEDADPLAARLRDMNRRMERLARRRR